MLKSYSALQLVVARFHGVHGLAWKESWEVSGEVTYVSLLKFVN